MVKRLILPVFCMAILLWTCNNDKKSQTIPDPWPLKQGTAWTFEGKCNDRSEKCRMEVTGVTRRGDLLFATMLGHPADVLEGTGWKPSVWGLLVAGNDRFYRIEGARVDSVGGRLADPGDNLAGLVQEQELMLQLPLVCGKMFGETDQLTRTDSMYCWKVTDKSAFNPASVGIDDHEGAIDQYALRFSTLPDETQIGFVPGIGITSFRYRHHGTPAEADMKLTTFNR